MSHPTPSGLAALYDAHAAAAFGLALRITADRGTAEDVVQDAFLTLWRKAGFDPRRGSMRTYLLTIVRNRSVDRVRAASARPPLGDAFHEDAPHPGTSDLTAEQVEQRDTARRIRDALAGLPDAQRRAIELSYFGGLSQAEVAAALDEPLGTIKSRMRLGLERLRLSLDGAQVA